MNETPVISGAVVDEVVTLSTPPTPEPEPEKKPEQKGTPRHVVYFPDARLTTQSAWLRLDPESDEPNINTPWGTTTLRALVDDLIATMRVFKGVGLSAVQVGVPLRLFVIEDYAGECTVMVNPSWSPTADAKKEVYQEGCLSFPEVFEDVERYSKVTCSWQDLNGECHTATFESVQAHAIQHETDHLDGHLFIEYVSSVHRDRIRQKMKQRARLTARIDKAARGNSIQALISAGIVRFPQRRGFRSGR